MVSRWIVAPTVALFAGAGDLVQNVLALTMVGKRQPATGLTLALVSVTWITWLLFVWSIVAARWRREPGGTTPMTCQTSVARGPRPWLTAATIMVVVASMWSACSNTAGGGGGEATGARKLSGGGRAHSRRVGPVAPRGVARRRPFRFVADDGDLLLVYFGYTACPDVCPTTLADLKAALKQLGTPSKQLSIAMATIDRRDTADVISGYLHSFFPRRPLRDRRRHGAPFGHQRARASYLTEYPNTGEPRVSHSAHLYVVDDQGHVVLAWPFGTGRRHRPRSRATARLTPAGRPLGRQRRTP
jgi:protein SCO1/2